MHSLLGCYSFKMVPPAAKSHLQRLSKLCGKLQSLVSTNRNGQTLNRSLKVMHSIIHSHSSIRVTNGLHVRNSGNEVWATMLAVTRSRQFCHESKPIQLEALPNSICSNVHAAYILKYTPFTVTKVQPLNYPCTRSIPNASSGVVRYRARGRPNSGSGPTRGRHGVPRGTP